MKRSKLSIMIGALFLISLGGFLMGYSASLKTEDEFKDLSSKVQEEESTEEVYWCGNAYISSQEESTEEQMIPEYKSLYEENRDLSGWISNEDMIDYPVMKTVLNQDYYLNKSFYKEDSKYGVPYLSAESSIGGTGINVIYGHCMKDGTMFGSLKNYLDDEYLESHKYFDINGLYDKYKYEVVAVFRTQVYSDVVPDRFEYSKYKGNLSEEEMTEYKEGVKSLASYYNMSDVTESNSLVALVTCSYHVENGRLIIVCKKVD